MGYYKDISTPWKATSAYIWHDLECNCADCRRDRAADRRRFGTCGKCGWPLASHNDELCADYARIKETA